ncbi:hypothetical protein M8494_00845 [Serratia ureilytica]
MSSGLPIWPTCSPGRRGCEAAPPVNRCKDNGIAVGGNAPRITSPLKNTTYTLRQSQQGRDKIAFNVVRRTPTARRCTGSSTISISAAAPAKADRLAADRQRALPHLAVDDRGRAGYARLVTGMGELALSRTPVILAQNGYFTWEAM